MKRYEFNKLVRDKLLERMIEQGVVINSVELDLEQYKLKLKEKLLEEAAEVSQASDIDDIKVELADVLEVITALMNTYNVTVDEVNEVRLKKALVNGIFDSKCFIKYIEVALDNKPVIDYMENKNRPYKLTI